MFGSEQFDTVFLIPFAVFAAIAAGVWWMLDLFDRKKPRAEKRLAFLNNPRGGRAGLDDPKSSEAVSKMLEKASAPLSKPLQPKNEKETGKLKSRLSHAGFRGETSHLTFLGVKVVLLCVGLVLGGGTIVFLNGFSQKALIRSVLFSGVMFYLPDIILWFIARKRKEVIFLSLPDVLDLMVVCVEAGLGLDQAMRRVSEEMKKTYRVICDELALCNFQMQMGRARNEVLHELGQRTGVDDLRALASILIQADKFGSSVGQALRVQSDSMRTRRKQLAEEKAAKTAVQLIFPLVLFIFPGIFVVLVGPAAITMVRDMFPMMAG